MFKKIKRYFELRRRIQREVLETLATICQYLDYEEHFSCRGRFRGCFYSHFEELKMLLAELKAGGKNE